MPSPRAIDPRRFFGYTGSPLPVAPESVPMSQQMRDRFKRHGLDSFTSYINPWETLARGQAYRDADTAMGVDEAENAFVDQLRSGGFSQDGAQQTGLRQFLGKQPLAQFSPMVQAYQKSQERQYRDPYEAAVAKEGAEYLYAYRQAVASGQAPMDAFAEFRSVVNAEKEQRQAKADDEMWFVQQGGDLDDFPALQQRGASRGAMLDFIRKKGKPVTTEEGRKLQGFRNDLVAAQERFDAVTADADKYVEDAKSTFKAAKGRSLDPDSKEDWDEAYQLLKKQMLGSAQDALSVYQGALEEAGKRVGEDAPRGAQPLKPERMPLIDEQTGKRIEGASSSSETTAQRLLREARERTQKLKQ